MVRKATGLGADIVIEVVGTQLAAALEAVRKGGKVLLFGINMKAVSSIAPSQITVKEAQLLGTWIANASFPRAVEILEKGILDLAPLITHTFPLEKTGEAIEVLRRGEGVKVFINPQG